MLEPLSNNLLIKGTEQKHGFIVPDSANRDRPTTGEVVAVGEKVKAVKVGDKVLVKGYMIDEIEIDEVKYLVCQEEAIIGKIHDKNI